MAYWRVSAAILVLACAPALAQQSRSETALSPLRAGWKDRPFIQVGRLLKVELRAKLHFDSRALSPYVRTDEGAYDLRRARLAIEGTVWKDFEYQVEREFRKNLGSRTTEYPWRDVYVNFKRFDDFRLKAGKLKIPFSLDQNTSVSNLNFVNRSRIADDLAPGRDIGLVLHGRFLKRTLGYEIGAFRNDGENSESSSNTRGGRTYALRLTGNPLRPLPVPKSLRNTVFGAAVTWSEMPDGLNSLRGRTSFGKVFFPHLYVKGRRLRSNVEAVWTHGPLSATGEFIQVREAREGQGVRENNLPPKISEGWYAAGTWVITGEEKDGGVKPKHSFWSEGIGAVELAGRYEEIHFRSTQQTGVPFTSLRAPNIMESSDRVVTAGVNWYLNRYTKIQANSIFERITDVDRSPVPGRSRFWTGVIRLQFTM